MRLRFLTPAWCCLFLLAFLCRPGPARADWLADLEAYALEQMAAFHSPGMAMVIVKNDTVIFIKGFGRLTADPSSPAVNADSLFLLGSTSKAFCATQLAVLADQHRIAWEDPVTARLPGFALYDPQVTRQLQVGDLLAHRSGLPMYTLTMMEVLDYPTADRLRGVRFVPPLTSFRTAFAYQNVLYTTAAKVVEAATGQSWGEHLAESLFTPLGMTRSVTSQAAANGMANVAVGHLRLEDDTLWPVPRDWFWNETQDRAMAAASVRTTAHDLGQWLRMNIRMGKLGTQQIVSAANMEYLLAPKILISPWAQGQAESPHWGPVSYCSGWMRYDIPPQPFLFHEGGAMGSGSAVGFAPGADIGIAVVSNVLAGDGLATNVVWKFYDLYFGTGGAVADKAVPLLETLRRTAPSDPIRAAGQAPRAAPAPDRPLASYCGLYRHPAYGVVTVGQNGDHLEAVMGPNRFRARLVSDGGNAFTAHLPDYPAGFEMTVPMVFEFPAGDPALLKTGPIVHDPQETFTRIATDAGLPLLLLHGN